jgi:hypothetical protein
VQTTVLIVIFVTSLHNFHLIYFDFLIKEALKKHACSTKGDEVYYEIGGSIWRGRGRVRSDVCFEPAWGPYLFYDKYGGHTCFQAKNHILITLLFFYTSKTLYASI